jgi:N-acetylglucosaminyl-diphospho-decaprenol L-rhamnosyltransferase
VAMGDREAIAQTEVGPLADTACQLRTRLLASGGHLPLAEARNVGAAEAIAAGAEVLIFLDVDCIPSASLIDVYEQSVRAASDPALHCGVVRYLEPGVRGADLQPERLYGDPHPIRPVPAPGERLRSNSWQLFWSLSFAVSTSTWLRLGGFQQEYVGYGAEDTDFGYAAHRAGVDLVWVGGADAHHQYHPTQQLPFDHLDDILRNAAIFERRWGFWPMTGWLTGFAEAGVAHFDQAANAWVRRQPGA